MNSARLIKHACLYCLQTSLYMIFFTACLNVAENRAFLEDKVGSASLGSIFIEVEQGLASIRKLEVVEKQIEIELWAQAPQINVTIRTKGQSTLTTLNLKIHNVMTNSQVKYRDHQSMSNIELSYTQPTVIEGTIPLKEELVYLTLIPPTPAPEQTWKFALFADVQERLDGLADLLRPLGKESVLFALISGDLTSMGQTHELVEFQSQMQAHLPFPCYATIGNHELGTASLPFYHFFGRGTFSFEYSNVRFSLLDGASATLAPQSKTKLNHWLNLAEDQMHVITTHIPILDPDGTRGGAFASRLESTALLSDFQLHKVDLLLYGHVHTFRSFTQAGIPAVISGGGGSIPMRFDGIGRHYVIFTIDPSTERITHFARTISPSE